MEVGALDELLDGPDVELAWLVEPAVDACVTVSEDELCPRVDVGALVELLDGPDVELAWLEEITVDDCLVASVDELCP